MLKSLRAHFVKKSTVVVVIQTKDGEQFVIDESYFMTRFGWSIARISNETTSNLEKTARRVMKYLHKNVVSDDYEVSRSKTLGKYKTHTIIWFPKSADFDPNDSRFKGREIPRLENGPFRRPQLEAIRFATQAAQERRYQPAPPLAAVRG